MQESYWFIRFSVFFDTDPIKSMEEIKGNAVYTLKTKSFLPGVVISKLKSFYQETLPQKGIKAITELEVYIDFVLEINKEGADDFAGMKFFAEHAFVHHSIISRHYSQKTIVVSV